MGTLVLIAQELLRMGAGTGAYLAGEKLMSALTPGGTTLLGGVAGPKRRRRRKMFTNTDIAQFAAAEAIGGKKAAVSLMMIRAAGA